MTNNIHPTAIISKETILGENNEIGPYCVFTGKVEIGNNNKFHSHVIINSNGLTKIGDNNSFFPFVSLNITQDKKYHGEKSDLIIGNNNTFREYSTANSGTESGIMKTTIGNGCLFMMSSHVAHDCIIGNEVILANSVALAGHVTVEDYVIFGGLSAVHQRTRIGKCAMIGGMSAVSGDVIPYGMVVGDRAFLAGLNIVGLKRKGFSKEVMHSLRHAYEMVFAESSDKNFAERLEISIKEFSNSREALELLDFISKSTTASRSLCKPR